MVFFLVVVSLACFFLLDESLRIIELLKLEEDLEDHQVQLSTQHLVHH